jgi:Arc/MetJ-type ribon-helix-helix transcriptional regulator
MDWTMTPDQVAFARAAVRSGRFQREEDAIPEALALWEQRERTRAELAADLDAADASIAAGKGRAITDQSMEDLATDVKQRGRARLADAQRRSR